jgi:hypothetical protein
VRLVLSLGDASLRRRVERVLGSFADVVLDDEGDRSASIGDSDISLPADPITHLARLLASNVEGRTGFTATTIAATLNDAPLSQGVRVAFPPPVGPAWAEQVGELLLAPVPSGYAAALASNEHLTLAVVDDARFLSAVVTAAPLVAAVRGITELEAASLAGLSLAERS